MPRVGVISEPLGLETLAPMSSPRFFDASETLEPRSLKPGSLIDSQLSPVRWSDCFRHEGVAERSDLGGLSFDRAALVLSAAADGLGIA